MQPDISVGVLTAGGMVEPHEEWTNKARENVLAALVTQQSTRGGKTTISMSTDHPGTDTKAVNDLIRLHDAVGGSILLHKYAGQQLPTKRSSFDWTLGSTAVDFGKATENDYALFLHAEDSFSSGGRVALQMAGLLGCAVGVCVMPAGGQQVAFVSLVDLRSGDVVWFNFLSSSVGDIRTAKGANDMVSGLVGKMKPAKETKEAKGVARGS